MSARTAREAGFVTHDGDTLFYRHWPATGPRCRDAIVLLHRGHEHSARVAHLVDSASVTARRRSRRCVRSSCAGSHRRCRPAAISSAPDSRGIRSWNSSRVR
ncbi:MULTISPECIES: hypothetical protein [unclassified Burkholderia]|uniref:hypothetical protein n=1 Tax=unclassified Burkholderia TaxID=2613784 RepID=UPI001627F730|nr:MULTISPECIES: hypothetical protein [unclassified Burkholderia]